MKRTDKKFVLVMVMTIVI
uniref:Uncharacterized protein n=1 Tax=Anguilla anguilla TaxID=7936 RepID=A0A0E9Q4A5_ANGAN